MFIQGEPVADASIKIAIVVSRFNESITHALLTGALESAQALGLSHDQCVVVEVPGAIEIPLMLKRLAQSKRFEAMIALGAVIRGETTHYDYVCDQVSQGCQQVMLEMNVPIFFGVLTTEDEAQALARVGGEHGHKGRDAMIAALDMISVYRQLKILLN